MPERAAAGRRLALHLCEAHVHIRPIVEADAPAFVALLSVLDEETHFMMFEPGERLDTAETQRERIRAMGASGDRTVLVAEAGDQLVGFAGATRGFARRSRHSASIVVGVRRTAWRQGAGRRLLTGIEAWARLNGVGRLELSVMTHNHPAIHLYLASGFEVEGRRRSSLRVDGEPIDEYWMARPVA
jgi:RimJ/RimL family protein N-acetyltransferase